MFLLCSNAPLLIHVLQDHLGHVALLLGDFNAVKKPLCYILSQRHVSFLINWMIYELHFANLMYDLTFSNTIEFENVA